MKTRHIALLGSTGSIGRNTLDVIAKNPNLFKLIGLAGGENLPLLEKQVRQFLPQIVSVKQKTHADLLRQTFPQITITHGPNGLLELVNHPLVNTMVAAISGTTALAATIASIKNNQRICLANKETLVAAGQLVNQELNQSSAELIPIDSEQSAIFQALANNPKESIKKIILTASGGPFFKKTRADFSTITLKEALTHPTWSMGTRITIDSATLMNKALEIIEAFYLFRLHRDQIDVIVHPQSIIHSMVEFIDASIIAQLSIPDMRLPILYSLTYPDRVPFNNSTLDFVRLGKLEFFPVDQQTFTSIPMAFQVLEHGKNAGAVLNAANEIAVDYFLKEQITFSDILPIVETIFSRETFYPVYSLPDILTTIETTKQKTREYINKKIISSNSYHITPGNNP